ncbi:MAG: metallophosphoesterase family protein [Thermodesulfobacteriota bacterium]
MAIIYVFSDLHANRAALEAIFSHIDREQFSRSIKIFAGDYLNFGPWPNETISIIRSLTNSYFVIGNQDQYILDENNSKISSLVKDGRIIEHINWTRNQLAKENFEWLKSLPLIRRLDTDNRKIVIFHGDYENTEKGVSDTTLGRIAEEIIICGHIHKPYKKEIANKTIVNPGSVGDPLDGDTRASFSIIEISGNNLNVEYQRINYDISLYENELEIRKVPWREFIIKKIRKASMY